MKRVRLLGMLMLMLTLTLTSCATNYTKSGGGGPVTATVDSKGTKYLSDVEGASNINAAYYENFGWNMGEDSDLELSASHITTRDVQNLPGTQVIMNGKGTKILKVIEPSPLMYIASARDINFKKGKVQSQSFGKAIGAVNNWILGWVTNTAAQAATAQNASNNELRKLQDTNATTAVIETKRLGVAEKLADKVPAEEAGGALGSALQR